MKPMKEYLIGISLCTALLVAGGCSNENDRTNFDGNNGNGNLVRLTIHATASNFKPLPASTRTPVEDGITTKFSAGDAIGLFVIKNGAIVDGVNNTKLTYLPGTIAGTGTWTPAADAKKPYYYSGETSLTYIAYYPYKDGITITPSQTTNELIASLSANAKLQPATDQSATDGSAYTASDLMTASATSAEITTDASGNPSLNFKFTHQFSLLVLVPRILSEYVAPAGQTYTYWQARDYDASNVTLNGITAYRMADGSFRAIVKPTATSSVLKGNYMDVEGRIVNYQSDSYDDGFADGGCYKLTVARPQPGVTPTVRALTVRDFFMEDCSILAGNKETLTTEEQANCIGIVYMLGTGGDDNLSYYNGLIPSIHGYVVALHQAGKSFGDGSKIWGKGGGGASHWGFLCTQMILEGIALGKSFPSTSYCLSYTPAPTGVSSGWYLPATAQVRSFAISPNAINIQLGKISGATTISGGYASSSEVTASQVWGTSTGGSSYIYYSKGGSYNIRPVLTF